MDSAALLRSFHGAMWTTQQSESLSKKLVLAHIGSFARKELVPARSSFVSVGRKGSFLPHLKASETTLSLITNASASNGSSEGLLTNQSAQKSAFPSGFEALILDTCEKTNIAEIQLKISTGMFQVGSFEMYMKRDIETLMPSPPTTPAIVSPITAPPIPSEPMDEAIPPSQPAAPAKSSSAATGPFTNVSSAKESKLAALEASGSNTYTLVSSPTVGTFRRARTIKGKKQPPSCKEGDTIKEGQTIGFLDQFGNELPVRSDVAGEILTFLYKDGEPVGYGDPLVAVLPSFHGIK